MQRWEHFEHEMATRHMLFSEFTVKIEENRLTGTATGETDEPERHAPAVEVKAAAFCQLRVEQRPDGLWVAQCVVDV